MTWVFAQMTLLGQTWYLVRHQEQGNRWHPATDNLAGTDEYGTSTGSASGEAFSIPFKTYPWTQMLISSGDMSMWVVLNRNDIEDCLSGTINGQWYPEVVTASG